MKFVGFAHFYLQQCSRKSKSDDKIDIERYAMAHWTMEDTQNFRQCLQYLDISDEITKVKIFTLNFRFKKFQSMEFGHEVGQCTIRRKKCHQKSKSNDVIDIQVYTELVQLDSIIGTTASEQLFMCLQYTTRSDIIKV